MREWQSYMDVFWDVVLIGSGIGGSVAAKALAAQGKKVLLIEKGKAAGNQLDLALWKSKILDLESGQGFTPFLGEGVGGSSRLYGMVMERLAPQDFKDQGGLWPGGLSEWIPFFEESERLFGVQSAPDEANFRPFLDHMKDQGLETRSLSLAFQKKNNCEYCQSRLCEKACRIDAWTGPLEEAIQSGQVSILTETEALELVHMNGKIQEVLCVRPNEAGPPEKISIRGRNFVLAAGALRTPVLIQQARNLGTGSNFSELKAVGHYLMRHFVDLYTLRWPEWRGLTPREKIHLARIKAWGTGTILGETGERLGILQSFGSLPPIEYVWKEFQDQAPGVQWIPGFKSIFERISSRLFRYPVAASIQEDQPLESNFVRVRKGQDLEIHYSISDSDQKKINQMRIKLQKVLGKNKVRSFREAHNNRRLAHVCGTCRMGTDDSTSVTDEYGQVHWAENLWVADSSVFPSSTDKNPSLAISAQALRVARRMEHHQG